MIKALREAAAKVPVPKKKEKKTKWPLHPAAHRTRPLLSEYNNALTGYKQADAAALPCSLSGWQQEARKYV